MPKTARPLSVAELERMLNSRKTELETLIKKRDKLKKDLATVEKRIRTLQGVPATTSPSGRGKAPSRPKNVKPLHQFVTDILAKHKKGLPLAELAKQVLDAGYKTNSKNFKNTLYQCLYNSKAITHDAKTGKYQLKAT
jgi:hypothetical protein